MQTRTAEGDAIYNPCDVGLHVCGDDNGEAVTLANFPCRSADHALRIFEMARTEFAVDGDEWDVVVDLNISRDEKQVADFGMHRQMLNKLAAFMARETV